ncbi:MAG TPA: PEP-CTERM sorting domain-containing protein [Candidatus Desulfobacillus sp.]|nr:PEP-CTERM sorting domain-containing protein [Candidatus Desulfobacillus sp.]
MKFIKTLQAVGFATAFVLAGAAQADQMEVTGHVKGTIGVVIDAPVSYPSGARAGEFAIEWGGNSFHAWCVDVYKTITVPGTYNDYTAVSAGLYTQATSGIQFDVAKIGLMDTLFTQYYNAAGAHKDANNSGAFQIALWEIVYDGGGVLDLDKNVFRLASADGAAKSTAQGWLDNVYAIGQSATTNWNFTVLQSGKNQDLLVVTAVPEPESWALMLAGLGVLVATSRRRLNKTA